MNLTNIDSSLENLWTALSSKEYDNGYLALPLDSNSECFFKAGIKFPEKVETVLVGFSDQLKIENLKCPEGKGFTVEKLPNTADLQGVWFALSRNKDANQTIFKAMVCDVLSQCLENQVSEEKMLLIFLQRITAWQNFMSKTNKELSKDEILGLDGELEVLIDLLKKDKLDPYTIIKAWTGPLDELHDFTLAKGDFEIKSLMQSPNLFINVGSAEQLDPNTGRDLYLVTCSFCKDNDAKTLKDRINAVYELIASDSKASKLFKEIICNFGLDDEKNSALEKFPVKLYEFRVNCIDDNFPCIARSMLKHEIRRVTYQLDMSMIEPNYSDLSIPFNELIGE